ncbi:MAG TPA: type III-B CRISPR module-associated protein Cmr5 [Fervidobacterium sp.]|nr:type III-B CRISPR module-associated protein Cmr5 [Fervidobacterium sp.]HOL04183.1 type III-B CRISPR module-associated protein Cmr5 [Fervidobacterium sp.]
MNENVNLIQKLEQGRAEFAYNCVKDALNKLDSRRQKEYKSYVKKIPQMILSNGLGSTLAFVLSKSEKGNAYDLIYSQIEMYLRSQSASRIRLPDQIGLIQWIVSCNSTEYKYASREILSFFNWLRRFAEGLIEGEADE